MSESTVGHVDDVGLDLDHLLVGESPPVEHALAEILSNYVADRDEFAQDVAGPGLTHVQRDAHLLDVMVIKRATEIDASALIRPWAVTPEYVPLPLPQPVLHPDDLRAEHGKNLGSPRPCELAREVTDAYVGQRGATPLCRGHMSSISRR